jgi:hypothetical protein
MAALKVFPRSRGHVADVDGLAGLGVGHQADIGMLVLKVEDLGQRPGGARKRRVVDDRRNLVAADPKVAPARQAAQELFAGARRHAASCRYLLVGIEASETANTPKQSIAACGT